MFRKKKSVGKKITQIEIILEKKTWKIDYKLFRIDCMTLINTFALFFVIFKCILNFGIKDR